MGRWAPEELVSAALTGDEAAAERLIAAVWPGCFRLVVTVTGDRGLAQDAAQEACVIVHRKVRGLRSAEAFDAWLYRIVMRESARVRRRNPAAAQHIADRATSAGGDPTALDVWSALAALPPEQRDVVVLFYFDDLTTDEIAAILRVRHPTVRTRLARARERLRGLLDDYRDERAPSRWEMKQHVV